MYDGAIFRADHGAEMVSVKRPLELSNPCRVRPVDLNDDGNLEVSPTDLGQLKISRRSGAKPTVAFSLNESLTSAGNGSANGSSRTASPGPSGTSHRIKGTATVAAANAVRIGGGGEAGKIPREHKFVVSNIAGHSLAVFSHTAGNPEAELPTPDK